MKFDSLTVKLTTILIMWGGGGRVGKGGTAGQCTTAVQTGHITLLLITKQVEKNGVLYYVILNSTAKIFANVKITTATALYIVLQNAYALSGMIIICQQLYLLYDIIRS